MKEESVKIYTLAELLIGTRFRFQMDIPERAGCEYVKVDDRNPGAGRVNFITTDGSFLILSSNGGAAVRLIYEGGGD